ncbi:MAG: hypothetical protein WCT20_03900 [Candidatus Babeliales bacterium]|jgi:hypothetical protein
MKQFGSQRLFLFLLLSVSAQSLLGVGGDVAPAVDDQRFAADRNRRHRGDDYDFRSMNKEASEVLIRLYSIDALRAERVRLVALKDAIHNATSADYLSYSKSIQNIDKKILDMNDDGFEASFIRQLQKSALDGTGKMVEDHVYKNLDKTLGRGFDLFIDRIISVFNKAWTVVYCNNQRPFTPTVIKGWQGLVDGAFDDIKRMLTDELRDHSRAADPTMRQGDDQTPPENAPKKINVWKDLISSYAQQFDYLASQMDKHKKYYDKSDDALIIFYADQIKQQLLKWRNLLLAANSLRELDTLVDSNKTMIEAMRNGLQNLFTLLMNQVAEEKGDGGRSQSPMLSSSRPKNDRPYGFGGMGMGRDDRD